MCREFSTRTKCLQQLKLFEFNVSLSQMNWKAVAHFRACSCVPDAPKTKKKHSTISVYNSAITQLAIFCPLMILIMSTELSRSRLQAVSI